MQLSPNQTTILDFVENQNNNLIISGVAGCGKSTTLRLIAETIRKKYPQASILYLAFNNEICEDIEPKLQKFGVDVLTFHKWGNRSIGWKKSIDRFKYYNKISKYIDNEIELSGFPPFGGLTATQINQIVDILRLWWIKVDTNSVTRALEHWNIDRDIEWYDENLEPLTNYVRDLILTGLKEKNKIDFVEMLTFPLIHKQVLKSYDFYLIDECQDLSNVMLKMIETKINSSRIISCGDRNQAINGFAGAEFNSFDLLKEMTQSEELPLSVCYRCPDQIIDLARKYVPRIEGTGKNGELLNKSISDLISEIQPEQMVICRKNNPLIGIAFKLMIQGLKVIIKGKDFGKYITYYINKVENTKVGYENLLPKLDDLIMNLVNKTRNPDRREALLDLQQCIIYLYENSGSSSFEDLKKVVDRLFSDNIPNNSVLLSSFHRSKGLENSNVWLLLDKPLADPDESAKNQESNLAYVAITRSLKNLYLVSLK